MHFALLSTLIINYFLDKNISHITVLNCWSEYGIEFLGNPCNFVHLSITSLDNFKLFYRLSQNGLIANILNVSSRTNNVSNIVTNIVSSQYSSLGLVLQHDCGKNIDIIKEVSWINIKVALEKLRLSPN